MRRIILIFITLLALTPTAASGQSPVVQTVLFYSPTCPHCHVVINEVLPPLAETYGDQLLVLYVDVSQAQGQALYQSAVGAFAIPQERLGVPTMIVGQTVMVGSGEIPAQLPGLIEAGLAGGGVSWPPIPGLDPLVAGLVPSATQTIEPIGSSGAAANPSGEGLAIGVLLGLMVSLAYSAWRWLQPARAGRAQRSGTWVWLSVPLVTGLGAALYLALVEAIQTEAFCGPVGDCLAVQASAYAAIAGVPVAWLGVAAYGLIAAGWLLGFGQGRLADQARLAVSLLTAFGSLVFVYLTYLEPFVIGAICLWCLLSAASMAILLALSGGGGRRALNRLQAQAR